jgi:hypothetical protein
MTQELDLIKQAGFADAAKKTWGAAKAHGGKAKEYAGKGLSALKGGAKRTGNLLGGGNQSTLGTVSDKGIGKGRRVGNSLSAMKGGFGDAAKSEARKSLGVRAGAAAGVGALGFGAKKTLEKEASAFETLASQRALQMLAENGYDVDQILAQQEQQGQQQGQQQMQRPQVRAPQQYQAPQLQGQGYSNQAYGNAGASAQAAQGAQGGQGYAQQAQSVPQGYEKVADPMEHFWSSLDARAHEILGDAGYLEDAEGTE